jgi:hypothetical protein
MRSIRSISFCEDDLDQQAFDFSSLAAEAIADLLQLKSGTPHLTARYQRMTHEIFIAIRSTIDSFAAARVDSARLYTPPQKRGPEHYQVLRARR